MQVEHWIRYFESNRGTYREPDWDAPPDIPTEALPLLRTSLATFQLGESGEGTALQRYVRKLAGRADFLDYDRALRLFVAEEQEHARLLARLLHHLGGQPITFQWTHVAFRWSRRLVNLEFEIQIFVTAEIIGRAYYGLLRRHLADAAVRSVCGKLIRDEVQHLTFHVAFFRQRFAGLGRVTRALWHAQFRSIFAATQQAVWYDHGRCLRAVGATRAEFFDLTRRGLARLLVDLRRERSLAPQPVS